VARRTRPFSSAVITIRVSPKMAGTKPEDSGTHPGAKPGTPQANPTRMRGRSSRLPASEGARDWWNKTAVSMLGFANHPCEPSCSPAPLTACLRRLDRPTGQTYCVRAGPTQELGSKPSPKQIGVPTLFPGETKSRKRSPERSEIAARAPALFATRSLELAGVGALSSGSRGS
jgi:hypothetical protein